MRVAWLLVLAAVAPARGRDADKCEVLDATHIVVGAGATGLAFVDTLINEDPTAQVVLVDRETRPGGHWVHAYDFVRLHQGSYAYGVNSRLLEPVQGDFTHLATKPELLAHYEQAVDALVATGRLRYYPLHETEAGSPRRFKSLVHGAKYEVSPSAKIVDATYTRVSVPSSRKPPYEVGEGVAHVSIDKLPGHASAGFWNTYCVVGAGKTGMDAVLWLLESGVEPKAIHWIMPNDPLLWIREEVQPPYVHDSDMQLQTFLDFNSIMVPTLSNLTHESLVSGFEAIHSLARIDPRVEGTKWRSATVSRDELAKLRRIRDARRIVRAGRVSKIQIAATGGISVTLEKGQRVLPAQTLFVDCAADGGPKRKAVPVFAGDRITLQTIKMVQPVFSAAAIGHLEARGGTDEAKNLLAAPIPNPDRGANARKDLARVLYQGYWIQDVWLADEEFTAWTRSSRLFLDNRSIGKWKTLYELLKFGGPGFLLGIPAMLQEFLAALKRVCDAEGGGC